MLNFGAIGSISSMKIVVAEVFSAFSKALRTLDYYSPAILLMILGPLVERKRAPGLFGDSPSNKSFTGSWGRILVGRVL